MTTVKNPLLEELLNARLKAKTAEEKNTSDCAIKQFFCKMTKEQQQIQSDALVKMIDMIPMLKVEMVSNVGHLAILMLDGLEWCGFINADRRKELSALLLSKINVASGQTRDDAYYSRLMSKIDWSKVPRC